MDCLIPYSRSSYPDFLSLTTPHEFLRRSGYNYLMELSTKLTAISGIGPSIAQRLELLNLYTVDDLINHYPFRYDDFSKITSADEIRVGEQVTLQGQILTIDNTYTKSRKIITKAILNDGTKFKESIVDFKNNWFIVSQMLITTIQNKITNSPSLT